MTTPRDGGYRDQPSGGARVRADIVDVYVVRESPAGLEFLQLCRTGDPLARTWQPVMGHAEAGEHAARVAVRELGEEVALEQVHPFYLPAIDCVVLSPRFVALVDPGWTPRLNHEHDDWRWVADERRLVWPGQRAAAAEIRALLEDPEAPAYALLRIDPITL